ncbi:endonuclease/exonuclease/phosphatase family protein [Pseudoalteromonas sp. JBTF-M23]|uniref:Endonuclease/exonuclease/phosphatase family protein n=1 Tax=Pseudoalteromonas caenipelagi TaxID=2726988 RepID=A0A849V947_9GAMM|nr:endonuclease/exonuclease/phosphatase family protein [Pseudoalteromonas caenipelagi]NOU49438.1 endonuclease/exonuclease/phosphatase family protein [Pseudoalteromonas caenipelagi]
MTKHTRYCFASLNLLNFAAPPFSFYQLKEHYSEPQWQSKTQFITGLIEHIDPTVIAFQEVFSIDELKCLCKNLGLDYFATVDTPQVDPIYPNVLFNPVVAIASKVPFKQVSALVPCPELLEYLNNQQQFRFNRTPVKCQIELEGIGDITCYAVHLKSQRVLSMAHMFAEQAPDDPLLSMLQQTVGMMQSQISRSLEASIIYYDALKAQREQNSATLVMGDFNDNIHNPALSFMTQAFPVQINEHSHFDSVGLFDSFNFSDNAHTFESKPATHYYQGSGNILDYILTSEHFNPNKNAPLVKSVFYRNFDAHLDPQRDEEDIRYSDHSAIAIEILV